MAATLAGFNAALKRIYTSDRLEEQIYQKTPLLDQIEKTKRFAVGETARVPLHVSRNGGYTALPSGGGTLNDAGNQGLAKAEYNYTNHHQQIALQGDLLDGTSSSALSVANALETEVTGATTDIRRQLQRQLFGNGDALIAQCRASSTNNVDLNTTSGATALNRGWIFVGQQVDIGTTADEVAIADGRTVTGIDKANVAFTVSGAAITGEGTTHYVSNKNSRTATTSYEMNGLRNIVSGTSTLGGLAPGTEASWASTVDTTSQPLDTSLMLITQQAVHQNIGEEPDWIVTGLKQARKFYEQLEQKVRYAGDGQINAGNSTQAKWQGSTLVVDPDCPDEDMYFLSKKHLFIVAIDKPYWQNKHTGGEILSWIQGTDSFGAKLSYRINLATDRRNAHARLGGLT